MLGTEPAFRRLRRWRKRLPGSQNQPNSRRDPNIATAVSIRDRVSGLPVSGGYSRTGYRRFQRRAAASETRGGTARGEAGRGPAAAKRCVGAVRTGGHQPVSAAAAAGVFIRQQPGLARGSAQGPWTPRATTIPERGERAVELSLHTGPQGAHGHVFPAPPLRSPWTRPTPLPVPRGGGRRRNDVHPDALTRFSRQRGTRFQAGHCKAFLQKQRTAQVVRGIGTAAAGQLSTPEEQPVLAVGPGTAVNRTAPQQQARRAIRDRTARTSSDEPSPTPGYGFLKVGRGRGAHSTGTALKQVDRGALSHRPGPRAALLRTSEINLVPRPRRHRSDQRRY